MMAVCLKSGKVLPERNAAFCGFECREKERATCKYYSHNFIDGTNCLLLRKPVDVKSILGIGNRDSDEKPIGEKLCPNL